MENIKDFVLWFLNNLPDFLLTEPISIFVGFAVLSCVTLWLKKVIHISN